MAVITHLVCLMAGATIGIFVAALCAAAKKGDEK